MKDPDQNGYIVAPESWQSTETEVNRSAAGTSSQYEIGIMGEKVQRLMDVVLGHDGLQGKVERHGEELILLGQPSKTTWNYILVGMVSGLACTLVTILVIWGNTVAALAGIDTTLTIVISNQNRVMSELAEQGKKLTALENQERQDHDYLGSPRKKR